MKKLILLCALIVLINSCKKDYEYPLIITGEITDINNTGAVFNANVTNAGKGGVIEYGFVWGRNGIPDIDSSKVVIAEPVSEGILSVKITNDLVTGANYFVRAFARNTEYITFSNTVSFISKGSSSPVISDFTPDHGTNGTIVTINGENFSGSIYNNVVTFGKIQASVESASNNKLVVKIGQNIIIPGPVSIIVKVADHSIKSDNTFLLE